MYWKPPERLKTPEQQGTVSQGPPKATLGLNYVIPVERFCVLLYDIAAKRTESPAYKNGASVQPSNPKATGSPQAFLWTGLLITLRCFLWKALIRGNPSLIFISHVILNKRTYTKHTTQPQLSRSEDGSLRLRFDFSNRSSRRTVR